MFDIKKYYILYKSSKIQGWLMRGEPAILYELASRYIKRGGIAAEIGSWKGKSSYVLANVCRKKNAVLYCIDTFAGPENDTLGINNEGEELYEAAKDPKSFFNNNIKKNLAGLPVEFYKMTSHRAAMKIKDKSLDFCFIDGDHTLPVIAEDIKDYLPKMKPGGVLVGHDYSYVENPRNDVKKTVDKLIGEKNITVVHCLWIYPIK